MTQYTQEVTDVLCDVFENFAFMFGEEAEKDELKAPSVASLVNMTFKGEKQGSLSLAVPEEICPTIGANFLGLDEDDEFIQSKSHDAIKELLNVVCGNLLTQCFGEKPVFDLSVPEVRSLDSQQWSQWQDQEETIPFLIDDYPVLIQFLVNES